jgi:hypothetical protein
VIENTSSRSLKLGIDSDSVLDPYIVIPEAKLADVVVGARSAVSFELLPTGIIEGMATPGSRMVLLKDEKVIKRTRAQFDGWFLFDKVPYGSYIIDDSFTGTKPVTVDPERQMVTVDFPTGAPVKEEKSL